MNTKPDYRPRAAFAAVVGLFLIAVVDAALVLCSLSWDAGQTAIANDPGKFVFHALLLPAAFGLWIRRLPRNPLAVASKSERYILAVIGIALTSYFAWYAIDDARMGFCSRIPVPADLSPSEAKNDLLAIRMSFQKELAKVRAHELAQGALAASAATRVASSRSSVQPPGGECKYELRSLRQRWSAFLTFLGLLFVEALILHIAYHIVTKTRVAQTEMETIVLVATLGLLWFPLRGYSEWYINFGSPAALSFEPFVSASAVAGFIALFAFALWVDRRVATTVFLTVAGLIPTTLGLLQKYNPDAVQALAVTVSSLSAPAATGIYSLLFAAIAGTAYYLWDPGKGDA